VPGSRVTLIAEIELPSDVHVYAPGVQGYKPIQLTLRGAGLELAPAAYPKPKILYLEAIREQVPVFEGKFRITQDATVPFSHARDGLRAVFSSEKNISISGELKYQACDNKVCFPPTSVPVMWRLQVAPLDLERSPEAIRRK
jgi:Disulphide bond corrector protein DsbC